MTKEPLAVVFERRASREVEEVDDWWRANRPVAPTLFATELERMLRVIALMPEIGTLARSERLRDVRRVLIRATGHGLYYRVRAEKLEVLAVWHAARGSGPGL